VLFAAKNPIAEIKKSFLESNKIIFTVDRDTKVDPGTTTYGVYSATATLSKKQQVGILKVYVDNFPDPEFITKLQSFGLGIAVQ
jgi:hypothetical protein